MRSPGLARSQARRRAADLAAPSRHRHGRRSAAADDVFEREHGGTVCEDGKDLYMQTIGEVADDRATRRSTIAVMSGGFYEGDLREAGAAAVFKSVAELLERLDMPPAESAQLPTKCVS
jgi:hypothetical protein